MVRAYDGTLSFVGSISYQKFGYVNIPQTVTGIISFAGSIIEVWVITPYTYVKNRSVSLTGTILRRSKDFGRTKDGSLSFSKYLEWSWGAFVHVSYFRTVSGILGATGILTKGFYKAKSGVLNISGSINRAFGITRTKDGSLSLSGIIFDVWKSGTQRFQVGFPSGVLSFAGEAITGIIVTHLYQGVTVLRGLVTRIFQTTRNKESSVSFRGRVYGDRIIDALYYGSVPNNLY